MIKQINCTDYVPSKTKTLNVKPFDVFPYSNVLFSLSYVITREVYSAWMPVVVSVLLGSDEVIE